MNIKNSGRRKAALAAVVVVPALALSVAAVPPASADTPARVALPSPNAPDLLAGGAAGTPLNPTLQFPLRIYLRARPGLAAFAAAVSDPHSPGYAHFLTTTQYQSLFAPTQTQTSAVRDWLTSQGMTVTATDSHYIAVTATTAQVDAAFHTRLSGFGSADSPGVGGGFSVPAALAPDIATVTGIDQIAVPFPGSGSSGKTASTGAAGTKAAVAARRAAAKPTTAPAAKPNTDASFTCSQYWAQHSASIPEAFGHRTAPTAMCGYTPNQIRQAYGVASSPYTGKGATIAIISTGDKPLMEADANEYFSSNGEAGFAPGQYNDVVLPTVAASCAEYDPEPDPEEPIDVESVHIAAPDAAIVNIATDCQQTAVSGEFLQDSLDGIDVVVDGHLADIVSGSFGIPEPADPPADTGAWDPVLEQGAVEGIGFDFSSGDGGDQYYNWTTQTVGYDVHQAQFPATDPWSTAVGGTSTAIGADGGVVADYPWGDNDATIDSAGTGYTQAPPGVYQGGSGGGVSSLYAEPGYQAAAVPAALATDAGSTPPSRVIPDVSADAGLSWQIGWTGAVTDGTYTELPVGGGTSASTPLIAGLEADAIQAVGHPLGLVNPLLYSLYGSAAIRSVPAVDPTDPPILAGQQTDFGGIDTTQLTTLGEDVGLTASTGFDDVTGLGAATPSFVTILAAHAAH